MPVSDKKKSKTRDLIARLEKTHGDLLKTWITTGAELELKKEQAHPIAENPKKTETPATQNNSLAIVYRRGLPRRNSGNDSVAIEKLEPVVEQCKKHLDGYELLHDEFGVSWVVEPKIEREFRSHAAVSKRFKSLIENKNSPFYEHLERALREECSCFLPEELLFIDIETTGLGSNPLFLIGTAEYDKKKIVVRQFLARDYSEEGAVISHFTKKLLASKAIVSFNGKSFDIPYIRTRAVANGIRFPKTPIHFDLLHASRKVWKEDLPDCKLQTLERHLCGRTRYGDIPGSEIPYAYHEFVQSGSTMQMVEILKHNMLDMLTLVELITLLPPLNSL